MKKTFILVGLAFLMVLLMTAGHIRASEPVIEIKVGTMHPAVQKLSEEGFLVYGKEIEKRTNGKVKFKWFLAGSLVQWDTAQKSLTGGLVDMVMGLPIWLNENLYVVTQGVQAIFLCDSSGHAAATMYKAYQTIPEMKKEYEGLGVKPLGFLGTAIVNVHTKGAPPNSLETIRNLKIGVPSGATGEMFKMWGAAPQYVKIQDSYMALQNGMVDAVYMAAPGVRSFKVSDLTDGHLLGNFSTGGMLYAMSLKKWKSLPPDVQKVFEDLTFSAGCQAAATLDNETAWIHEEFKKRGDKFSYLTSEEKAKWSEIIRPYTEKVNIKPMNDRGLNGKEIMDKWFAIGEETKKSGCTPENWWGNAGKRQ